MDQELMGKVMEEVMKRLSSAGEPEKKRSKSQLHVPRRYKQLELQSLSAQL